MGQKTHPVALRLEKTNQNWNFCWYSDYNYTRFFLSDCRIQNYIQNCSQQFKKISPVLLLKRERGQTRLNIFSPQWRNKLNRYRTKRIPLHLQGNRNVVSLPIAFSLSNLSAKWFSPSTPLFSPLRSTRYGGYGSDKPSFHPHKMKERGGKWMTAEKTSPFINTFISPFMRANAASILHTPKKVLKTKGGVLKSNGLAEVAGECHILKSALHYSLLECLFTGDLFLTKKFYNVQCNIPSFAMHNPPAGLKMDSRNFRGKSPGQRGELENRLSRQIIPVRKSRTPLINQLESALSQPPYLKCKIHLVKCLSTHLHPVFIASQLVLLLQARKPFRQIKHQLVREISKNSMVQGVRMVCSGRVSARSKKAQKARTDSIQWGETSTNVFSQLVNFASTSALTAYGKIGVKVWVCYKKGGFDSRYL